jgi:hypothetical protein
MDGLTTKDGRRFVYERTGSAVVSFLGVPRLA